MVTVTMKLKEAPCKKRYDKPRQCIKKQICYITNNGLVKVFFFQSFGKAIMYGCESWTINKTEHQRIDAFELWCWRRPLRVPWTAR